jgi:diketogulonate reductase-like aldo/keto reductase
MIYTSVKKSNNKKSNNKKSNIKKSNIKKSNNTHVLFHGGMIKDADMPGLCFGTVQENLQHTIINAINVGYRHIDCADVYASGCIGYYDILHATIHNYKYGKKVKKQNSEYRNTLWITWKSDNISIANIKSIIQKLDCGYIDLFLIHFWRGDYYNINILIQAQEQGLIHHYGVSNCENIGDIIKLTTDPYKIYANQIQARPPDGNVERRNKMDATFIEQCNERGVRIMLFGTISGCFNSTNEYFYTIISKNSEFVKQINKYYLQKYLQEYIKEEILYNNNVLMVGSISKEPTNLQINFDLYNTIKNGHTLLEDDEVKFIEDELKKITLGLM